MQQTENDTYLAAEGTHNGFLSTLHPGTRTEALK